MMMLDTVNNAELQARLADLRLTTLAPEVKVFDIQKDLVPHTISVFSRQSAADMQDSQFLSNHHFFILLLAFDGHGHYELDERTYHISPGTALLTFPFQVHCYSELSESLSWLFVRFDVENSGLLKDLHLSPRQVTDQVRACAVKLMDTIRISDDAAAPLHTSLATIALIQALSDAPTKRGLIRESEDNGVLKQHVQAYVMDHIAEVIQVSDIADQLGISTSYLRALFKRYYGVSVGKFILKQKITHACHLILSTAMQMQEIASACGFGTAFSFSRAFKRMMCLTPREYRDWFHTK